MNAQQEKSSTKNMKSLLDTFFLKILLEKAFTEKRFAERTCAKKGMKVKEKRKRDVRGVFLFFPSFQS
jgi:hypothetical protein